MSPDLMFPEDVTQGDYDKASSKFATPGAHLSECQEIEWETPQKSIKIPFVIIEEGPDNGKEGKIVCGLSPDALFKIKEVEAALGVQLVVNKDGRLVITEEGIQAARGKQFLTIWTTQKDTRSPEEGGKGSTYTKATGARNPDAVTEDLPF